jgi:adenylate cyclase
MRGVPATAVLVGLLLGRCSDRDIEDAYATIQRVTSVTSQLGLVLNDLWLLRMRAQVARARGDESAYQDLRNRYRRMAGELGFEGHIAMAAAL